MQIRYYVFFILSVFIGINAQAQYTGNGFSWERVNVEAGWGVHYPAKPAQGLMHDGYTSARSFYIGGLYELDDKWGLRISAAYNKFKHSKRPNSGLTHLKYMAEGTLNFIEAVSVNKPSKAPGAFDIMLHSGFGISAGKSAYLYGYDKSFTFQMGAMPRLRISKRIHLQLDMVAVFNFWQAYDIDGLPINDKVGAYLLSNIGLSYGLGRF